MYKKIKYFSCETLHREILTNAVFYHSSGKMEKKQNENQERPRKWN